MKNFIEDMLQVFLKSHCKRPQRGHACDETRTNGDEGP